MFFSLVTFLRFTVVPAIWSAFRGLRKSPFRSFIILQGIIWATVLGILPPAVIRGSREAAVHRATEVGSNRVLVFDDAGEESSLGWKIVDQLRTLGWEGLASVAAYGLPQSESPLLLVDCLTPRDAGRVVEDGRWFTREELAQASPVCVISQTVAAARFGGRRPVNEFVEVSDGPHPRLKVIGVVRLSDDPTAGLDNFGYKKDHPLHGLIQEMMTYLGIVSRDFGWVRDENRLVVPAGLFPSIPPGLIKLDIAPDRLSERIADLRTHLVREGVRPTIIANPAVLFLFSGPLRTIEKMHGVIFFICLLVGSVIVANTVILTLLGRKREIAVRRVEGATTFSIAVQFLTETGTVCLVGSLLGIPLAVALAWIRTSLDPSESIQWMFPFAETVQTVAAVAVVGLLGGFLPALKAARVQPAEVLSHE